MHRERVDQHQGRPLEHAAEPRPTISRIVAAELSGDREIRLYIRSPEGITEQRVPFTPWLITTPNMANMPKGASESIRLHGDRELSRMLHFSSWSRWREAYRGLRDAGTTCLAFPSPAEQYLIQSGNNLFGGLEFDNLVRAQVDIETLGLTAEEPENAIIVITATINGNDPVVFRGDQLDERELISSLTDWIIEQDPDTLEGHNLFNFDLPFLATRARRHGQFLEWGRDGSAVRFGGSRRFKSGARSIPYDPAYVYGRHVIDTYQQIQRYDATGQIPGYGLKEAIDSLGLTRDDRSFIAGDQISRVWRSDPDRLIRYAVDDVLDTNTLSELALPTEFYQAQLVPGGLQDVATGGSGEKINDLMVRAYVLRGESIPLPSPPASYPGGYTAVRATGSFGPIVKADVESLYPAIMLTDRIYPKSDQLGVFLPMLESLTNRRLNAKQQSQNATGYEFARWQGLQSSLKVLVNSFYGYLGYSRGYFNDYDAARRVTLRGHEIIQQVERELEAEGSRIIEIDTDGVYFQPATSQPTEAFEQALIDRISSQLDPGINLAHDGRWQRMLSLRQKNYALLGYDGQLILKGSSLRSRREEPFLRRFIEEAIRAYLQEESSASVRDLYFDIASRILNGEMDARELARTETLSDTTFRSETGRRLAEAARGVRIGERVTVYQRADGSLARVEDYHNDEDRNFLLRRLRDGAGRFRILYDGDAEFEYDFPRVSTNTDLDTLRHSDPVAQPRLF